MIAGLLLAAAAVCQWQNAHYTLVGDPAFTVDLVALPRLRGDLQGDLAFGVRSTATGHVLWFAPGAGASGVVSLESIDDPTQVGWQAPDNRRHHPFGDVTLAAFDRRLGTAEGLATSGDPAATFLVMPEIADTMEHAFDHADGMSNTIFKLTACYRHRAR